MKEENGRLYSFDSFQVDPARRRLWRAGEPVQIHSKTFDLLLALIENSGRVLEKDELMRLVWPNQIVEDGNLTVKMSTLRKLLGERKDEARFIVTIPGRGYRFVADVKQIQAGSNGVMVERHAVTHIVVEEESESVAATDPAPSVDTQAAIAPAKQTRTATVVGIAAVILVLVAGGFFLSRYFRAKPSIAPFARYDVSRQTNSGRVLAAAVSPNGQYFAFAQDESDGQSLWLKHVPTGASTRIVEPKLADYWGLTFTPDGHHIYATTFEKSDADPVLSKIPILGGVTQTLPVVTNTAVTFAPDGSRMAYAVSSSSSGGSVLWTANADGSGKKFVALRKDPNYFAMQARTVSWSPKGDTLACVVLNQTGESFYMTVVGYGVNDGKEQQLTDKRWNLVSSVEWTADGHGLMLTGNDTLGGPQQVWFVSPGNGLTRRVTNDLNNYGSVSLTGDRGTLLAVQTNASSAIWTAAGNDVSLPDFRENFSEVGAIPSIGLMPGNDIVYQSVSGGTQELWLFETQSQKSKQLTVGSLVSDFAISPDGQHAVIVSNRAGKPNLWRFNTRDWGNPVQLTSGDGEIRPRFAADGKFVFFQKGFGDVLSSVWKVATEGGVPAQVTQPHNSFPDVSSDGKYVVYSYMDSTPQESIKWRLGVAASESGKMLKSFALPATVTNRVTRWTSDGKGITYISTVGGVSNLWLQPIDGGDPRQITNFTSHQIETFDWSRDGKIIAVVRKTQTNDVVLLRDTGPG